MGRAPLRRFSFRVFDDHGLPAAAWPRKTRSVEPQDKYVLVLEDIDELFTAMVTASRLSPAFLGVRHRLKPALREWYAKDNFHPMEDMFRTDPPAGN